MDSVYTDWEAVTEAQVKEAEEGDLFPTGTYEGIVQGHTTKLVDSEKAPKELLGKHVARVTVDLLGTVVRGADYEGPSGHRVEPFVKPRKFFFDAAPSIVKEDGKLHPVSKNAAAMAKATNTVGEKFGATLDAAPLVRLRFRLRLSAANEEKG
jgi:hypothetical protein